MTSFDLDLLNLHLLPIQESTFDARTVETNFRELLHTIRLLTDSLQEVRDLFVTPEAPSPAINVGRYLETFTASSSFVVNHFLVANHPQVSVFNSAGTRIETLVTHVDLSTVRLDFTGTLTDAVVAVDVGQTA